MLTTDLDITNYNRGTIALQKNKLDKALQFFKREKNEFKELYLNLANTYRLMGISKEAWKYYHLANNDTILDLDGIGGEYDNALGNMGLLAYQEGNDTLASSYYVRALTINPLHTMSIWNNSLALLRSYCSGGALHQHAWKMHEYRFKAVRDISACGVWDGSYVDKLIVLNEQGMGDKLMYGRYLSLLAECCSELWVQCPAEMDCFFSAYKTCRTVEESGCSVGIPFGNLPSKFGLVDGQWLNRTKVLNDKLTVGVEWSGSTSHLNDKNRSCYAGYFSALAKKFSSIRFINVRPDSKPVKGVEKVASKSWADSTTLIAGCDLVISVDTSLVHLAGSLGVETWLLQPLMDTDFRWGNAASKVKYGMSIEDNLWYESVKVLDNKGWDLLFSFVESKLREKHSNWQIWRMLGGNTIEQFVEKYNASLSDNRDNNNDVPVND